jgi:hypothetical protein
LREQFLPLQALVAVDHRSPLYNESSKASIFYAESWALLHYLILGEDGRFAKHAAAFAAALGKGQPLDEAARTVLGVTGADLEKGLRRYVGRDVFFSQRITFSDRIAKIARVEPQPLGGADVHATLGDVLLQMGRKEDAKAELVAALALDDGTDPRTPRWACSTSAIAGGKRRARILSAPWRRRPANFLCHYYYGLCVVPVGARNRIAAGGRSDGDGARLSSLDRVEPGIRGRLFPARLGDWSRAGQNRGSRAAHAQGR